MVLNSLRLLGVARHESDVFGYTLPSMLPREASVTHLIPNR